MKKLNYLLLTVMLTFSYGIFAKEYVFICTFSTEIPNYSNTLLINTKSKYIRFNSAKYDKEFIDTDLYIEAKIIDSNDFGNQLIHFNKITGEVRRELDNYNLFHECKESSRLIPSKIENNFYKNEIIFYEEFSPLKNEQETAKFSEYYQSIVGKNEPDTLGWKFFKEDEKVIAILRWKDSQAIVRHLENVSEGGILEEDFKVFNEHFAINRITVYGNVNSDVRAMLMDFGLPFEFNPLIAGYSR